ncbi:hypothetical protein CGZ69_02140 [Streptomyces peucetius subsp. caesius ATCC 27952]|nr:hypothetical protein CGZ69_02140 [Streptomyces peucetius subsp. caesius ATCC 27952]
MCGRGAHRDCGRAAEVAAGPEQRDVGTKASYGLDGAVRERIARGALAPPVYDGEIEMHRHDPQTPRAERSLLYAYWACPGTD